MTKEFTAKQMHNAPGQVFRAADKDGRAKISHEHYKDRNFFLIAEDKEQSEDLERIPISTLKAIVDSASFGTGVIQASTDGIEHIPLKDIYKENDNE